MPPLGSTPPTGWSVYDAIAGTTGTNATVAGTGNPGQSGNLEWTGSVQKAPGIYLVDNGPAYDATKSITGNFDFYVVEDGNYSNINFVMGDLQSGSSGAAGKSLNLLLREATFGARAALYDGANTELVGGSNNNQQIATDTWYTANFTWTPTSGTTGDIAYTWGTASQTKFINYSGYTFSSNEVYFGFGTGRSPGRFDNISIAGTVVGVPEPSSLALLGLGGIGMLARRRR